MTERVQPVAVYRAAAAGLAPDQRLQVAGELVGGLVWKVWAVRRLYKAVGVQPPSRRQALLIAMAVASLTSGPLPPPAPRADVGDILKRWEGILKRDGSVADRIREQAAADVQRRRA